MPNNLTKNKVKNYDNYYNSYNPCPFIIHNNSPIKRKTLIKIFFTLINLY